MASLSEKEFDLGSWLRLSQGISICLLLSQLYLDSLRSLILDKYYIADHNRFRYDPILLLKLAIVRNFRNLTYKSIVLIYPQLTANFWIFLL